jgi:hypothetical protein
VYRRILRQMQTRVHRRRYVTTLHANEEMVEDGLTVYDVERGILSGEILERQNDRISGESKFRIRGQTVAGDGVEVVAKLSPTDMLVIITVYSLSEAEAE